jgi:hypothetical protein
MPDIVKPVVDQEGKVLPPVQHIQSECKVTVKPRVDGSCSDAVTFEKMIEFLERKSIKVDKTEVLPTIKKELKCDSESCVLNTSEFVQFIGTDQQEEALDQLKMVGPANDMSWLNNEHIDQNIASWKDSFKDFHHIKFQLADFDKTGTELADLDVVELYSKGIRTIGCVLNTDSSGGSGIHWYAIFIDMRKEPYSFEIFDSTGRFPQQNLLSVLEKNRMMIQKAKHVRAEVVNVSRQNRLQFSNSECGLFSLWYIFCRLNEVPFQYFSKPGAANDDMMLQFRKILFRTK